MLDGHWVPRASNGHHCASILVMIDSFVNNRTVGSLNPQLAYLFVLGYHHTEGGQTPVDLSRRFTAFGTASLYKGWALSGEQSISP
jgi:hypothetical protein